MHAAPLSHLTLTATATRPIRWPHYAGSALRGAFGTALHQSVCITGQEKCAGCQLQRSCAYSVVFDPLPAEQPLHPSFRDGLPAYVIHVPDLGERQLRAGEQIQWSLTLLPPALAHWQIVQSSAHAVLERYFAGEGAFKTTASTWQTHTLPDYTEQPLQAAPNSNHTCQITLQFRTPLRIQQQGSPIRNPAKLTLANLIRAAHRRHLQWCQISGSTPVAAQTCMDAAAQCTLDTRAMQWHDLQRRSRNHSEKVPLGGLIGALKLQGPAAAIQTLQILLTQVQPLHIGKEAVFGLGDYSISA